MNRTMLDEEASPLLLDIAGAARTLWSRRLLVLVVATSVFFAAGLYVAVTRPVYTATASLLVDPRAPEATDFGSVLPAIGADSAAIASQVSVIESRSLLGAVFDRLKLVDDPEFTGQGLQGRLASLWGRRPVPSREAVFSRFQQAVSVDREGLTYVIDLGFKSHDPNKAARVVNAIIAEYQQSLTGERSSATSRVNGMLSDRIDKLEADVAAADRAVEAFKDSHRIYDSTTGGTLQSQIDQLTQQLITAEDQANQAESRYQQALADGTSPQGLIKLSEIASSPVIDQLRNDYNQRAATLANAQALYGPKHPTIVSLTSELAKVEGLMAREATRIIQQLQASRDLADANVKALEDRLAALRAQADKSQLAQVQLRQLQGKADAAHAVLSDFLKRAQQTAQMQGLQLSQVRVLSPAVPPAQPSWPKPMLLLPVSALLGLIAGSALALGLGRPVRRERVRTSFETRNEDGTQARPDPAPAEG